MSFYDLNDGNRQMKKDEIADTVLQSVTKNALNSKHNAIFVIPPTTTAEVLAQIGEVKPEYDKIDYYGNVIFWSASIATYSRTRLTKIVQSKAAYNAITIRNANTVSKLVELVRG